MTWLLVALGAAAGAPLRYLMDRAIQARYRTGLPWGTFAVNVTGSFVLGLVAGSTTDPELLALLGSGLCGAFTTFSTFSYETVRLVEDGRWSRAIGNVLGSVLAGLAAVALGLLVAS
jgi:CrcB protein